MERTLTVGILSYTMSEYHRSLTEKAVASYSSADEVLVVEDGTGGYYEADTMINLKTNHGFTYCVNQILRSSRGDFIAVANNDTHLISGNLKDLCIPGVVTTPSVPNQTFSTALKGCFFVIPKELIPTIGYLDESMRQYYSDQELDDRLKELGVPVKEVSSVVIYHEQAQTLPQMPQELMPDDEASYTSVR